MTIPTVTDDLLAEIEAAAKAATPGVWDWGGTPVSKVEEALEICRASIEMTENPNPYFCEVYTQDGKRTAIVGNGPTGQQNARHIAAASPANVLALIARLRELEKDAARYRWLRCECSCDHQGEGHPMLVWKDSRDEDMANWPECLDKAVDAIMQSEADFYKAAMQGD